MKSHFTYVKVRYAETDQMGVVYHGNYAQYLEIARIDWLDALGISYRKMEEEGVMLPVYELNLKFKKSAKFDDELKIVTRLKQKPGVRIAFEYEIFNQHGELLTTAETTLIFMDVEKSKPIKCPQYVLEKLGY
ncbi:acyl-CoA thioesterase [Salinimicrobium sediminilitoris]|uniref:acyl-CoA thioesterase n=1 Tax=Salinimicrobium sediminilitoris TaxID=2876715 RepID=UPI001E64E577|nr:thioesterase family protein [Salinimicrobium sediminilitoris]MCC8361276.1 acyl-CoA thioesterase [Salinimicrobium sediminilitoris]